VKDYFIQSPKLFITEDKEGNWTYRRVMQQVRRRIP